MRPLLFSVPLLFGPACEAQTITQAWDRALAAEPSLRSARAGQLASVERTRQARGALFPQLDASFNGQRNFRDFLQEGNTGPDTRERFPSRTAQLNLTQPLWRPLNWASLAQARASEQQAAFQTLATEQDLHVRFVVAWFDLMGARDNVVHAGEQVEATRQQQEVMRRGVTLGTHNEVQASDAEARYQQALAEQSAARAELDAKNALLEQITGALPGFVPPQAQPGASRRLVTDLEPLATWLARVEADNPAVLAAQRALEAAREDVRKQEALHQPTFDLVARRARVLQGSGNSPGQAGYRSREHSFGVQLNVPLFSGGTASAKIREAEAMVLKAEAEVESARRNAVAQARQGWSAAQAARARSEAGEHAQRAAQVALRAATTGQVQGMKTLLDELQARQQLAAARRDQQRADYDGVVALVRLRAAAGQPAEDFLPRVEGLMVIGERGAR